MALTIVSFVVFLLMFTGIGVYSATRKQESTNDYLVASRGIGPWFMSLSAVATNNSGFMFVGLVGSAYTAGVSAAWLMVGWVAGDWLAWLFVHQRLREQSESANNATIPSFLGHDLDGGRKVRVLAGVITLIFLAVYSAAQLRAGSKAMEVLFEWDGRIGVVLGAVIVAAYCVAGGIRASIWTDVAQSVVMMVAIGALFVAGLVHIGGVSDLWTELARISAEDKSIVTPLNHWIPEGLQFGFAGYLLGWMGAGFGVVGQPHVMVRAMTLENAEDMAKARRIYVVWYTAFAIACVGVGLCGRVLLSPESLTMTQSLDPELALPVLSTQLLPGIVVGLILAGLFAATISTADSQVLSCSAALTQDLPKNPISDYKTVKIATMVVTGFALLLALYGPKSVFTLVTFAWSSLAAGLGPLLIVRVMKWPISSPIALAMMVIGVSGALGWSLVLGWSDAIYEVAPGMICGFLTYGLALPALRKKQA